MMHHQANDHGQDLGVGIIIDNRQLVFCSGTANVKRIKIGDTVELSKRIRYVNGVHEYLTFSGAIDAEHIRKRYGHERADSVLRRLFDQFDAMEVYWCGVVVLQFDLDLFIANNGSAYV